MGSNTMLFAMTRFAVVAVLSLTFYRDSLAEPLTISIATGEFPPLYTETTETNGVVLQVVAEAFASVDIQVAYEFVPWARANRYAQTGKTDASCCWFEQVERASFAHYSNPVFSYSYSFFHLTTTEFNWETIEDLIGIPLGATISYTYTTEFTQAEKDEVITVDRVASDLLNLKKLLYGRIVAFPLNTDVGYYLIQKNFEPEQQAQFTHHPKPLFKNFVHLVFPKRNEQSTRLLALFNNGLRIIKNNGAYQKILTDYQELNKVHN